MIKKLYKIFTSRMFWMLLVFGLQIGALAALVLWSAFSKAYYLFFTVLSIIMGVIIITRKENSAYRLMWMFVIIIFQCWKWHRGHSRHGPELSFLRSSNRSITMERENSN